MSFYPDWILPSLIDLSMRNKRLRPYRERTAGAAEGRVLDIGIGSGLNLPFYGRKAREIFGLDPSLPLLARLLECILQTYSGWVGCDDDWERVYDSKDILEIHCAA